MPAVHSLAVVLALAVAVAAPAARADDPPRPEVRFLSREEAATALSDESAEPYASRFQTLEIFAKTGWLSGEKFDSQREGAARAYRTACRDFTADEKAAIGDTARALDDALGGAYPLFAQTAWQLIKLEGVMEGGLPHTRGRCVVLSDRFLKQVMQLRAEGGDLPKSHVGELLVRVKCHVMQRAWPAMFERLYVDVWRFIRAKDLPSCPWLVKHQLLNPDGLDVGWVYPVKSKSGAEYWQPLQILKEGVAQPRMPDDVQLVAVALDKRDASYAPRAVGDGRPVMRPLAELPEYAKAFGAVSDNVHPNATCAVMFSWIAMRHIGATTGPGLEDHSAVDLAALTAWCKKSFAKPPVAKR